MEKKNKHIIGAVCAAFCSTVWGFSFLFTKQATEQLSAVSLLAWRFTAAFLVMHICVMAGVGKVKWKGKRLRLLIAIAVLQPVIYYLTETFGIAYTTTCESGVMIACIPIVTVVMSALILKKKPVGMEVLGICITMAGVCICVLSKGLEAMFQPLGYLMLTIAVVSYSVYSVFAEKAKEFTSVEKTYVMLAFGAGAFDIAAVMEHLSAGTMVEFMTAPFTNGGLMVDILYLSVICSVAAFFLYNVAIECIGPNRAASFAGLSTVVSIAAGVLFLQESFSLLQLIGSVLVIGGVYAANRKTEGHLLSKN